MAKHKWYKSSHWTYKENRGWLMERGIVAFPRFSLVDIKAGKMQCLWETPNGFQVDPEMFPKKKRWENPVRKKAGRIISLTFPITLLPISHFR